jgi:hypothetical protein
MPRHGGLAILVAWAALVAARAEPTATADADDSPLRAEFAATVQPILAASCVGCHDADTHESGVRLDGIAAVPEDAAVALWERIERELTAETMPPADAAQPSAGERAALVAWVRRGLEVARSRPVPRHGATRRVTVAQYRHTLHDLLGIDDDVTARLPPDAVSRDGFTNQIGTLQCSELQVEAFLAAAERALDAALDDPRVPPRIQRFRVELGTGINPDAAPEALVLGHISQLLASADVLVTEPAVGKPFPFEPVAMQRQFRFIEGYQGNDTVRGWREFAGIHHAVFACLRGSDGDDVRRIVDPRGRNAEMVRDGLLVGADPAVASIPSDGTMIEATPGDGAGRWTCTIDEPGIHLVHVRLANARPLALAPDGTPPQEAKELVLDVGGRHFAGPWYQSGFVVVRLPAGPVTLAATTAGSEPIEGVVLELLDEAGALARRFARFERRTPWLGVHLGLRRDCGSTLTPVGAPQAVAAGELADYLFEGALGNFPDPDVEPDNPNYLAGVREIAVRSEYTVDRDMPRLLVRSVEFGGPFLESWPPPPHRAIVDVPGAGGADAEARVRAILTAFAARAFRRPATAAEVEALVAVWRAAIASGAGDDAALRDALLAVLASAQFLFLVETSAGPEAEPLTGHELSSKLSYFLWNSPPDDAILGRAAAGTLAAALGAEVDRLVADPRFSRFADTFVGEWLGLGRFDVVETDRTRHPRLTAHAKPSLGVEPARFFEHLVRSNAPLGHLVAADVVVVNEVVAEYYGCGDAVETGFTFVPVAHRRDDFGGLLTLPAVLAGLSDGREPNPVKRGA